MADIGSAWCGELRDVSGLRQEGAGYLHSTASPLPPNVEDALDRAHAGDKKAHRAVSTWLYPAVLSGRGCPFPRQRIRPHRRLLDV